MNWMFAPDYRHLLNSGFRFIEKKMPQERRSQKSEEREGERRKRKTRAQEFSGSVPSIFLCEFFSFSLSGKIHGKRSFDKRCKELKEQERNGKPVPD